MCRPLNPQAREWRPRQHVHLLPHFLIPAAPPPRKLLLSYTAAAILPHYIHSPPPIYIYSFPPSQILQKANPPPPPPPPSSPPPPYDKNPECLKLRIEASKSPQKKFLPPRLRKRYRIAAPPLPPPKQKWRLKKMAAAAAAADESPQPLKTTLMIKNIPNQLRRDFMLKFIDGFCKIHSLAYDFFYLPIDFRKLGNLGYAFVNFTTAAAAIEMKKLLCNYQWRSTYTFDGDLLRSRKVCQMTWAKVQGKEALVRKFKKSNFKCDDVEFLPVVLDPPRDGSDPNPPPPVNLGRLCRSGPDSAR